MHLFYHFRPRIVNGGRMYCFSMQLVKFCVSDPVIRHLVQIEKS